MQLRQGIKLALGVAASSGVGSSLGSAEHNTALQMGGDLPSAKMQPALGGIHWVLAKCNSSWMEANQPGDGASSGVEPETG